MFNFIQTFFVDPSAVNYARQVNLTSAHLYFRNKPARSGNKSGINSPGVVVWICECDGRTPLYTTKFPTSVVRVPYDQIFALNDASVATQFSFATPVTVTTGKYYGIVIKFEDPDYRLWQSVQGENLVGSAVPSPGPSGKNDGYLYEMTNTNLLNAKTDADLKFVVNIAKYTQTSTTVEIVNDDYEFLTMTSQNNFVGGEYVYQNTAVKTGTVLLNTSSKSLIGTGTTFNSDAAANAYIVLQASDSTKRDVRRILSITSNTLLELDTAPSFANTSATYMITPTGVVYYKKLTTNTVILSKSSANATAKFTAGETITGVTSNVSAVISSVDNYYVDQFIPEFGLSIPPDGTISGLYSFAILSGSNLIVDSSKEQAVDFNQVNINGLYSGLIASRSKEANSTINTQLHNSDKSSIFKVTLNSNRSATALYESPQLTTDKLDLFTMKNYINDDATNEHLDSGNAYSKHITTRVNFANNRFAEDIRVYMTAYKPANTDIKVYARIYNSGDPEAFEDKLWTELELVENANVVSSTANYNDYVEYSYGFPQYPVSNNKLTGYVTTTDDSATITGNSTLFQTQLAVNDTVKLYNPVIPENYMVAVVNSITSNTVMTLVTPVTNNNIVGTGFVIDKLKYNTAFNNILNDNVVRYYNSSSVEYDTYDSFSLKIVLLSDTTYITPRVNNIRAIGVSA